jgi:putative transposase
MEKGRYKRGDKQFGYAGLCKAITKWRNGAETPWLADSPCHPPQQMLEDLEWAYTSFFVKHVDFPRFKRRGSGDDFRYPDPKQIKLDHGNSHLFLAKLGWLRYRKSRDVLGELRNVTVSLAGKKWFAPIQTQRVRSLRQRQPAPSGSTSILHGSPL